MTNDDFEDRVKRRLNQSVDTDLGPRRPAPPFQSDRRTSRRPVWLIPLAVAAMIAVISGGAVGVRLVASRTHTPAGNSTTGNPSPSPSPSTVTKLPGHALTVLGTAKIAVPRGWQVTPQRGGPPYQSWCLAPAGVSAGRSPNECPVYLSEVAAGADNQPAVRVDAETGSYGDPPQWCFAHATMTTVESGVRTFGGRTAEWRLFHVRCQGAPNLARDVEQYVVPTDRSFIVFAPKEDATTAAGLRYIVQNSQLPNQDRPLRMEDYGLVTSVVKRADGYEITLDRIIEATGKSEHAISQYLVPTRALLGDPPKTGDKRYVFTNGTRVIQSY